MDFVEGPIPIGEWMPDNRDLQFPNLEQAKNCVPFGTIYKSFAPLNDTGGNVSPGSGGLLGRARLSYAGTEYFYVATNVGIYESPGAGAFTARSSSTNAISLDFIQYDNIAIAAAGGTTPSYRTLGSASNFSTLGSSSGTAPSASRVGRINDFVILGNLVTGSNIIQWSGIGQPLSWPTPNSATAIAQQSGSQSMNAAFGEVTGFSSGDQYGIVFQLTGISRVTYVGPPAVFQFDRISEKIGCRYPRSIIKVEGLTYFIGNYGIFRTDGVSIANIGDNKVNKYLMSASNGAFDRVWVAVNVYKNLIYWAFCEDGNTNSKATSLLIYNYVSNRFSWASQSCTTIFSTTGEELGPNTAEIYGLGNSFTLGSFNGTPGTAQFITGDIEYNPGGFTRLQGTKLIVDQTSNAIVGYNVYRNDLTSASQTTSAASTTNSSTGFCDFNIEARYHRARWDVSGAFDQAQTTEFKAKRSGSR